MHRRHLLAQAIEMRAQDQAVRTGVAPPGDDRTLDELFAAMGAVDAHNQSRLAEIFQEHGWPGWALVGEDGSTAAWAANVDARRADAGLNTIAEYLEELEAVFGAPETPP